MLALTVASLAAKNNADSSSCGSATNPNATMRVHRYAGSGAWNTSRSHQLASSLETQVICDPGTDVANAWHSQNGQDRRALHILGGKGFFVDMAANKPVTDSNTRSLERDHGWRGLCVDGNVAALPELARRRSCTVAGAIVSSMSDAHVQYRRWQGNWKPGVQLDGMSGIVSEGMGNTAKKTCWGVGSASGTGWPCLKIDTRDTARTARDEPGITVTLHALLRHFDAPKVIDYMSLDVCWNKPLISARLFPLFCRLAVRV